MRYVITYTNGNRVPATEVKFREKKNLVFFKAEDGRKFVLHPGDWREVVITPD